MADKTTPALSHALQGRPQLGKYTIRGLIGRGAMADVYLAHDTRLELDVAIKVIHASFAHDSAFVNRFRQEARAVAALNHRNIVRVFSFDEEAGLYYLAMRYIAGDTLNKRLSQVHAQGQFLPWQTVCDVMQGLCGAVGYAHRKQLIHRDIKPSNVMFDTDDGAETPVLTDFGVAKVVDTASVTNSHVLTGTPMYMSPEQARSEEVTGRSDIYSLGIMLFEMATGAVPFQGDNMYTILLQHWESAPPVPSHRNPRVPPELDAVILRALAKDPGQRYPTAETFAAAIRQAAPPDNHAPEAETSSEVGIEPALPNGPPRPWNSKGQPTTTLVDRPPPVSKVSVATQTHVPGTSGTPPEGAVSPVSDPNQLGAAPLDMHPDVSSPPSTPAPSMEGESSAPTQPRSVPFIILRGEGGWEATFARAHHVTLGRAIGKGDHTADIDLGPLDSKRTISRQHAQILMQADGCFVRDLQSRNGVAVNGVPVPPKGRRRLDDGDTLTLGDVRLTFHQSQKAD